MENLNVIEDSEREFLDAFFTVDENVRSLIEREKGDWLFNKINSLKYDSTAIEDIGRELKSVLKPMELLLINQPWFNWGGFLSWNYFDEEPFLLESFYSTNSGYNTEKIKIPRYKFARNFYNSQFFSSEYDFQEILGLTFEEETQSFPILLIWRRTGNRTENPFQNILHFCDVTALNTLTQDEEFNKRFEDLLNFVNGFRNYKISLNAPEFKQLADKIRNVTNFVLTKNPEIIKEEIESLREKLFKSNPNIFFTDKQFLNLLFWNRCFDETWQYIFYIPGNFLKNIGAGGVVFASEELPTLMQYKLIEQSINRVFGEVAIVFGAVESRMKERSESIRAPFHEFKTISSATKQLIKKIERHPNLLLTISKDAELSEAFDKAKFFSGYANIAYSYFKHRGSGKWQHYDELTEEGLENVDKILSLMYKPALGNTFYRWHTTDGIRDFIHSYKDKLFDSVFNIKNHSQLSHLQVKGEWQTAFYVASFILTCNMIEHGIKAMSEIGNLINFWHELSLTENPRTRTFSFCNIYTSDQATYDGLKRIKNRFEEGNSFDFKNYGGMLVLDTILGDFRTKRLEIKVDFLKKNDSYDWVSFDLSLPNEAFEEVSV